MLPSRYEPFGFVYLETMMGGCITIASKVGGGLEIIQNGVDGFTIEPMVNNIVACIQKIKRLSPQQLNLIVRRAKKHIISTYDMSRVESSYAELYQKIESRDKALRTKN